MTRGHYQDRGDQHREALFPDTFWCIRIALGGHGEVQGVAVFGDSPVGVAPLPANADVGLIQESEKATDPLR